MICDANCNQWFRHNPCVCAECRVPSGGTNSREAEFAKFRVCNNGTCTSYIVSMRILNKVIYTHYKSVNTFVLSVEREKDTAR